MSKRKQRRELAQWAARTRAISYDAARRLALTIAEGRSPGIQAYDLGIVLHDGETAWQRVPAYYWWRGEQTWIVQHVSRNGRRSSYDQIHQLCMHSAGMLDWLITNQRLAARQTDGQVMSIWWTALEAITVDLDHEIVTLDGPNGYHGELRGPAIAPIAVSAIALAYGPSALLDHPGLRSLRANPDLDSRPDTKAIARRHP